MTAVWLFGYGSLIWRPSFPFLERRGARVHGWVRRFWQGSHDHRGLPHAPGRVVTLVPESTGYCDGIAYCLDRDLAVETMSGLDHREKNGYERHHVTIQLEASSEVAGIVYIARRDNHAFLGPASLEEMVVQIRASAGPSGTNLDYVLALGDALRQLHAEDDHVFELEARLRRG